MPLEQKPKPTLPLKSEKKLLIGLAILLILMFVMIAAIIIRLTSSSP